MQQIAIHEWYVSPDGISTASRATVEISERGSKASAVISPVDVKAGPSLDEQRAKLAAVLRALADQVDPGLEMPDLLHMAMSPGATPMSLSDLAQGAPVRETITIPIGAAPPPPPASPVTIINSGVYRTDHQEVIVAAPAAPPVAAVETEANGVRTVRS